MPNVVLNAALQGIEISFDSKPGSAVLDALKEAGFRWHHAKKIWYAKQTPARIALAESFGSVADSNPAPVAPETAPAKNAVALLPLWERCKVDGIPDHNKSTATKQIAAETRAHIKARFPEIKFSCRIGSGSWGSCNEVNFYFQEAPWPENSVYFNAVENYVKKWLWSYNYDNSDIQSDYFDRGFYETISTYNYKQLEPTPDQVADMRDYDTKKAAFDAAEAARIEAERIAYEEDCKKAREALAIRDAENKKKLSSLETEARIVDLADRYIVTFSGYAGRGKEASLEEVLDGNAEKTIRAEISRELHFTEAQYKDFSGLFMYDFSLVAGFGGTGTLDQRVNDENFYKLNADQREEVEFMTVNAIAVYVEGRLSLIVNPEGYNYSRYVDIVTAEISRISATDAERIENETAKPTFHFPAPITDQAEKIETGKKYTIISLDPFSLVAARQNVTITAARVAKYAQYENALYLDYIESGRKTEKTKIIHDGGTALLYPGFIPETPPEMIRKHISGNMYEVMNAGSRAHEFMINLCKYYTAQGIDPVVNTLQY